MQQVNPETSLQLHGNLKVHQRNNISTVSSNWNKACMQKMAYIKFMCFSVNEVECIGLLPV